MTNGKRKYQSGRNTVLSLTRGNAEHRTAREINSGDIVYRRNASSKNKRKTGETGRVKRKQRKRIEPARDSGIPRWRSESDFREKNLEKKSVKSKDRSRLGVLAGNRRRKNLGKGLFHTEEEQQQSEVSKESSSFGGKPSVGGISQGHRALKGTRGEKKKVQKKHELTGKESF